MVPFGYLKMISLSLGPMDTEYKEEKYLANSCKCSSVNLMAAGPRLLSSMTFQTHFVKLILGPSGIQLQPVTGTSIITKASFAKAHS